jgi:prepilin-type N-terminal cleavage/methylation domain-containing protein
MKEMYSMRNNKGFTLMELMTVIGILGILGAIAIPGYLGWRDNAQLRRAAQDMYSIFQKAKIEAARRNATVAITFAANFGTVFVDLPTPTPNLVLDAGEIVISSIDLSNYPGVNFDTSEGGGDGITFANPDKAIAFAPNGFTLDNTGSLTSGTVFLTNRKGRKASIRISPAGNVGINRAG